MKAITQTEAVAHLKGLLKERGHEIGQRHLANTRWVVFEHQGRLLGIDPSAGIWVRTAEESSWRCLASPCTVSGAIQAVEFLISK